MTVPTLTDPPAAVELRERLAEQLAADGAITSPQMRAAFAHVPRHTFVPEFTVRDGHRHLAGGDAAQQHEWLAACYADAALVTTRDSGGTPTSSSSQPSIMAAMLELLELGDRHRVLEIGTGTGYNTALLCELSRDYRVTSMDIDRDLIDVARARLANCGYHPVLVAADGMGGWVPGAPYDRIVSTCGTGRIPALWPMQVRPGGRIVASIGDLLVALHVGEDGSAVGPFSPRTAAFVPLRDPDVTTPAPTAQDVMDLVLCGQGQHTRTTTLMADMTAGPFRHVASVVAPGLQAVWSADGWYAVADPGTGSWARAEGGRGGATVTQDGPRRLWDAYEDAHAWWVSVGRPGPGQLGLTVGADGAHRLWVGAPGNQELPLA